MRRRMKSGARIFVCSIALSAAFVGEASAQRIENQVAVFAALDKVTARISRLEVKLGDTVAFGALNVTPKVCYSRPPTEPPKTTTFVQITEKQLDGKQSPLFSGWMFAESPGLNAVEHPVYDLWLTECLGPKAVAQKQPSGPAAKGAATATDSGTGDGSGEVRRRRPPR